VSKIWAFFRAVLFYTLLLWLLGLLLVAIGVEKVVGRFGVNLTWTCELRRSLMVLLVGIDPNPHGCRRKKN
jgi:hypothetical protein